MIDPVSVKAVINSRLLVLQSKQLMLGSLERRFHRHNHDAVRERAERLRAEVQQARDQYRTTVLALAAPEHVDYWVVAYSILIGKANGLAAAIREAAEDLPLAERYEASSDVEMLESIVTGWNKSLRKAMAEAVA